MNIEELRIYNVVAPKKEYYNQFHGIGVITLIQEDSFTVSNHYPGKWFEAMNITKEILKDNLGFTIHDMGDFWQCEKEDFILVQPKLQLGAIEMPYIFVLKSSINGSVQFKHVHHLQNTYLDLKGELLQWKH